MRDGQGGALDTLRRRHIATGKRTPRKNGDRDRKNGARDRKNGDRLFLRPRAAFSAALAYSCPPDGRKARRGQKNGQNGGLCRRRAETGGLARVSRARADALCASFGGGAGACFADGAEILARARAKNRLSVWRTRGLCVSLQYRKRLRRGPLLVPLHTVGARYAERLSYLNFLHAAHTVQSGNHTRKELVS